MNNNNNGPVVFINAEVKQSQSSGKYYLWSKSFDLQKIINELGTTNVNITVVVPSNAKNDFQRTILFKPSNQKFQDNGREKAANQQENIPI